MQFMFQINISLNLQLFKNISHIYIRKHAIYVPNKHFIKFTIIQKHFSHIYANIRFMFQINILLNLQLFKNNSHIYICKHAIYVSKTFLTYIYANMRFMFQMNILLNLQLFKNISHMYTQTCNLCSK